MKMRTGLLGGLALVFSASAALVVFLFAGKSDEGPGVETVSVVVATGPVPRGATLSAEMLTTRDWPRDYVPEGALLSTDEAVGRTAWLPLVEDDPVIESKLATLGAGRGMAALIPSGMRAVTIQTPNVATGVAGFILPGNKVDVLWTDSQNRTNDPTGGGSTVTLLQNVEILAVDQRIEIPNENMVDPRDLRSVTLLVTPSDATKLDLGQNRGTLRLSLRNPEDSGTELVETITLAGMRGNPMAPIVATTPTPKQPAEAASVLSAPKPVVVDSPPPARDVVLPIRTLRGTSSGAVYLRQRIPRTAAVVDEFPATANRP